jgi:hypothetical protein
MAPQGVNCIVGPGNNASPMDKGVGNCHTAEPPVHPCKGRAVDSE